jgi:hypothetical protein
MGRGPGFQIPSPAIKNISLETGNKCSISSKGSDKNNHDRKSENTII